MTYDDLDEGHEPERARRGPAPGRPPADREVPLGRPSGTIADGVHAWLDGDSPESIARRGPGAQDVELWKRLDADLARRRRLRTPPGLDARIMAAIPMDAPRAGMRWWERELVVTHGTAIMAVVTLATLAATATALLLR